MSGRKRSGLDSSQGLPGDASEAFVARLSQRCGRLPSARNCVLLVLLTGFLVLSPLLLTGKLPSGPLTFRSLQKGIDQSGKIITDLAVGKQYPLEPRVCPKNGVQPEVVLFVPSRPGYAEERAAVRETWGLHARLCNVRVVFGFGSFESTEIQHETLVENSVYGDLLQTSSVIDAYHNQTRLILSFFQWAAAHCQRTKFIGKADEDTWLNIFGLLKYLQLPEALYSITGHFLYNEKAKRLPEEKWFVTMEEYANDTYPPFAVGQLYIFPTNQISAVLSASKQLVIHWLDDVFIGGQIPKLLGLNLLHVPERCHLFEVEAQYCFARYYFIIHAVSASAKRRIFYDSCMKQYRESKCPVERSISMETERVVTSFVTSYVGKTMEKLPGETGGTYEISLPVKTPNSQLSALQLA